MLKKIISFVLDKNDFEISKKCNKVEINSDFLKKIYNDLEIKTFLNKKKLQELISVFKQEMRKGLNNHKSSLAMIPSLISTNNIQKKFLYSKSRIGIDFSGSHLRLLKISNIPHSQKIKIDFDNTIKLDDSLKTITNGNQLFNELAKKIKTLLIENKVDISSQNIIPTGFTFSYPFIPISKNKGKLIYWSKGFSAYDVINQDPVYFLNLALHNQGVHSLQIKALLNDTTATLLSKQEKNKIDASMIIGTGTNICVELPIKYLKKKISNYDAKKMIVVTDSGNFDIKKIGIFTDFDMLVDQKSENPGIQPTAKMISGKYLSLLFKLILEKLVSNTKINTFLNKNEDIYSILLSEIAKITDDNPKIYIQNLFNKYNFNLKIKSNSDAKLLQSICKMLLKRSAKITASIILATITFFDHFLLKKHNVIMDGSVYTKNIDYQKEVQATLNMLGNKNIKLLTADKNASVLGAIMAI